MMSYLQLPTVPPMQHLQLLAVAHKKRNMKHQLKTGFMNKNAKEEKENQSVITKFFKISYFLTKEKWAVKNNFSDIVEFLKDVRDKEIVNFLTRAPQNAKYTSKFTVKDYNCFISDYLDDELITSLN